jgi:hypothetical protein
MQMQNDATNRHPQDLSPVKVAQVCTVMAIGGKLSSTFPQEKKIKKG